LFFKRLRETCEELLDREFLEEAIKRLLLRVKEPRRPPPRLWVTTKSVSVEPKVTAC